MGFFLVLRLRFEWFQFFILLKLFGDLFGEVNVFLLFIKFSLISSTGLKCRLICVFCNDRMIVTFHCLKTSTVLVVDFSFFLIPSIIQNFGLISCSSKRIMLTINSLKFTLSMFSGGSTVFIITDI